MANNTETRMTRVTVHGSGVAFEMATIVSDGFAMADFVDGLQSDGRVSFNLVMAVSNSRTTTDLIDAIFAMTLTTSCVSCNIGFVAQERR